MHTSKKLLITAMFLASSATYAEQTRDLNGHMVLVYSGTAAESALIYHASSITARAHATERKFRMERLHSKLAMF
jgi:hypothetical protein